MKLPQICEIFSLLITGRRINSATLVADARHSWLDALSSAGALVGLIAVALGQRWGDPVAGMAVTGFICHVGYEVTGDAVRRLADGIDPRHHHHRRSSGRGRAGRHSRPRLGPMHRAKAASRSRGVGTP